MLRATGHRILLLRRCVHRPSLTGDSCVALLSTLSPSTLQPPHAASLSGVVAVASNTSHRGYSRTALMSEGQEGAVKTKKKKKKNKDETLVMAARDFNNRRAAYQRQVSKLRKSYAAEVAEERAADESMRRKLERDATRRKLERQRRKNIRSAQNAIIEKERRAAREKEFQQHLNHQQQIRDAKNERLTAARQLVIDILEEEAPLWMTTPEEVEAAFTPEAEQLLWAFPGGVLGAPNPSLDSHMWQHETHTWHMRKSYKTKRAVLLERIQEQAYNDANIDPSFWTPERLAQREEVEERARLRADVQRAGRRELLQRQAQMMTEQFATKEGDVPKAMPAPSMKMQADERALEREGAKLLMEHPERFFVFDKTMETEESDIQHDMSSDKGGYTGETLLGSPVALRSVGASEYPVVVGKLPKPDTRTEREKKQAERQERMLAAARAQALQDSGADADDAGAEDSDDDREPPIDYDAMDHDSDDEEWEKGLDPTQDKEILETPSDRRYTMDDIEWTLHQLEEEAQFYEDKFAQEMESLQIKEKAELDLELEQQGEGDGATEDTSSDGHESGSIESILLNMSDKELFAISDLDDVYTPDMPTEDFAEAAQKIPSLTEEQLRMLMDRERP